MALSRRGQPWVLRPAYLVVMVVVLAVAAAVVVVVVAGGDDDPATAASTTTTTTTTTTAPTTTTTTEPPRPVAPEQVAVPPFPEDTPGAYRITYDVVENQLPRTETVTVRRPYESLVRSERDGQLLSGSATSRSRLWTYLPERDGWLVLQPELHRASYDQRPLRAMAMAISLGRAEETGTGSFAGTACRVFLTGQPLGTGGIAAPTEAESTELCIDARGLVLHERWTIEGSVVVERTATSVEIDPPIDPAMFDPGPVVDDAEEFEAVLSTIAVPADEETLARLTTDLDPPPEGYVLDGTVLRAGDPNQAASISEIVRFFSDGTDLLEVAEVTAAAGASLDHGGAVRLDVDGPETWFWPDFRASAVRVRLTDTTYLELRGTDPAQLIGLLDALTRRTG